MKKIKLIIAFVGLFCISYIETTENKTKLSSTQQKEMNTAIRGYKDSLARIQGIVLAGKKPSSSDTKTRDAQKKNC